MAPYFGAVGQKAVWDKGLRYFTRGLHPGSPRSPGTFRSTPAGNTCSPRDRGASEKNQNLFMGTDFVNSILQKAFIFKKVGSGG